MVKATIIVLAAGDSVTAEAGEGRCWASEEVATFDTVVSSGTLCDICGEEIEEPQ